MYIYIERCDCELVTAYPYNEFPTQKLLSDIRYMIEQLEDTVLFFKEFNSKDVKWLEKHKITNWSIHHVKLRLSKTVKSEQELTSFMTNVLNHFKTDVFDDFMTMNQC